MHTPVTRISRIHSEEVRDINRFRLALWGALLTGAFASTALDGGQAGSVVTQLKGVLATLVYGFVVSYIILKVIDMTIGLRVNEEEEREGLDVSLHGEHVE